MEDLKNILIIKPSALGDIIMALPALKTVKSSFPEAKISWLIKSEFAPILKDNPYIDDIILFKRKELEKFFIKPSSFKELKNLIRKLRNENYDAVIDLQGLFRTASIAWLTGCRKRFGMDNAREFSTLFYTQKAKQKKDSVHIIDHYLQTVKLLTKKDVTPEFDFPVSDINLGRARELILENNIGIKNFAILIPAASKEEKCWPQDKFAKLADTLKNEFNTDIVAVGAPSESGIIEKINSISQTKIHNLAGKTTLTELAALLKLSRIVISNDTGPGHIAAALNKPLVMIFGHTNPRRLGPYNRPEAVAAIDYDKRGDEIKADNPDYYINNVTVKQVMQKVRDQIS